VADNQYAAMGLMLMATLARVRKLILPLKKEVEDEKGDSEGVLGGFVGQSELDLGEVVRRVEIEGGTWTETGGGEVEDECDGTEVKKPKNKKRRGTGEAPVLKGPVDSMSTKRPKKKRKKGDAFDDIFDSLI
jgi:ribonuclease MRP protein subunit RMP1